VTLRMHAACVHTIVAFMQPACIRSVNLALFPHCSTQGVTLYLKVGVLRVDWGWKPAAGSRADPCRGSRGFCPQKLKDCS